MPNPFFIIEVMRSLAQEAGQVRRIAVQQLPQHVLTGGIQAIVQRRLGRLPQETLPLLRRAAVAGRQIDPRLLAHFAEDLEAWLFRCADAAVLEVSGQSWRFAHDKIRESLLSELTPAQTQQLHRELAQAMEAAYPDSPPHAAVLAEHHRQAGNAERAAAYLLDAGSHALAQGATEQAVTLLEQAQALEAQAAAPLLRQVRTRSLLMRAYIAIGRIPQAIAVYEDLMARTGQAVPRRGAAVGAALLSELVRHVRQLWWGHPPATARTQDAQINHEVLQAVRWAAEAYIWDGQPGQATLSSVFGANLAALQKDAGLESYFLCGLGYTLGLIPLRGLSERYMRRAGQRAAASADAGWQLAFARGASLVYLNSGDWAAAHAFSEDAMKLARQLGDFYLLVASLHYQALMAFRLGDEATFAARSAEMLAVVKHNPSPQFRRAYPLAMGTRALRRGQLDAARELLQEAWQYVQQSRDSLGIIAVRGQMALCALRLGDPAAARAAADETLEHIRKTSPTSEVLGEGFSSVAEVYLELWERGSAAEREQLAAPLRQALRALRRCGLVFPTTAPRAFLWHSRYLWNQGHHRLARALAESSLRRARALKLPHDEALAAAWLLRYRGEPPPKR